MVTINLRKELDTQAPIAQLVSADRSKRLGPGSSPGGGISHYFPTVELKMMRDLEVTSRANPATGGATTLSVVLNPECNGGESISLDVDVINNGDGKDGFYTNVSLNTACYGTSTSKIAIYNVPFKRLEEAVYKLAEAIENVKVQELKRDNPRYS